ncbi:hypothetical protein SO802_031855 [Lithocarpus litseifolius]|uniref:Retrotransposon gag domain-containing protein n=1 Tax=Lithocarpus litseifolius TaxID=425828 RepID=A0AAW2BLN3_9ROSI
MISIASHEAGNGKGMGEATGIMAMHPKWLHPNKASWASNIDLDFQFLKRYGPQKSNDWIKSYDSRKFVVQRPKAMEVLIGVGENYWSESSADHISLHFEGIESSGEVGHLANRNIMSVIEDLQRPQGSPYLTKEDISIILFEAKKIDSTIYVDTRPPYPEEVAGKPYPVNYTHIFPKYDGMPGNAREHIRQYVDALMAHSYDHELRLREFSKPLEGRAFTWYTSLALGSVLSWNDLATHFMKNFFTLEEKLTLSDLQNEKQRVFGGLLEYICRFRDLSLLCYDPVKEEKLVDVCITSMLYEYRPYLENLQIFSFTRLVEASRRTSMFVRKPLKGLISQAASTPR